MINDIMNDWMEKSMVQNIVNEKNEVMNGNKNLVVGERIIGLKIKEWIFYLSTNHIKIL